VVTTTMVGSAAATRRSKPSLILTPHVYPVRPGG
jgi:hypothetical protein